MRKRMRWILPLCIAMHSSVGAYGQQGASSNPGAGEWGKRASLVEEVSEHAVAELNGKIYVIAGNTNNGGTVATVQVYDVATDRWTLTNPLPIAVNHNMAAAANGKLYSFGGQTASATSSPFTDAVYAYDPATGQWSARAPMPTKRSAGATAVINGKIYVAGGRPPQGHDFAVYDPAADAWTRLPDLPTQRNHLAVAAINGKVYVAGGRFEAGNTAPMTDILEIYDPATNRWSQGARMPTVRGGINGLVANGCFHVFGGEGNAPDPKGIFHEHEAYDPATNAWTELADMPIPVHGVTGAAFLNGLIYLPAGAAARGGGERSKLLQVYRPAMACR
jgi:N-acetylneuraminic acid mutarotase